MTIRPLAMMANAPMASNTTGAGNGAPTAPAVPTDTFTPTSVTSPPALPSAPAPTPGALASSNPTAPTIPVPDGTFRGFATGAPTEPAAPTESNVFAANSTEMLATWLMKGGDCPKLEDSWVKKFNVPSTHKIAVAPDGNRAFAASQDGTLSAFDPATGDVQWTKKYGTLAGTPAVSADGSSLVALTHDGTLVALDPATGDEKWKTPLGTQCNEPAITGANGSIALRTADHRVFRVQGDNGQVVFSRHLGKDLSRGPMMGSDGAVYVTDYDLNLHALNPTDGSTRWTYGAKATITTMAMGSDDTIYLGRDYGRICAVDSKTGTDIWSVIPPVGKSLENMRPILTVADAPKADQVTAPGAVFGDTHSHIYAANDGGFVYSLDARNGNLEWTSRQTKWARPQPVVMPDGTVAAGADDYNVYGLDPSSGTVLWKWPQYTHGMARPTVDAHGRIFCNTEDQMIHMAEPERRFEQAAQAMADATSAPPAGGASDPPKPASAGVQVEDSWIVVGGVRIPRRG